jgi:2-methylcitrate dehydratase PrpD
LDLTSRIHVRRNTSEVGTNPYTPTRITVRTTDGNQYSTTIRSLRGSPEKPLSWEEIVSERLKRCVEFSSVPIREETVEELTTLVQGLEEAPDVRELIRLMTPQ